MKLLTIIILNAIFLSIGLSQPENKIITNRLTQDHIHVPGTKISLIPPVGYKLSKTLIGFENENSSVEIMESNEINFSNLDPNEIKQKFQSMDLIVNSLDLIQINDLNGFFIRIENENSATQLILGDSTYCAFIMGKYDTKDKFAQKEIEESILSAYYNSKLKYDANEVTKFEIDLSSTNLELYQYEDNEFIYNTDSLENIQHHKEGATLRITQLPTDALGIQNLKAYTLELFNKLARQIDGLKAIEQGSDHKESSYYILSKSTSNEKDVYLYLILIVEEETSFLVNAASFKGLNTNMKNIITSIRKMKFKNGH